MKKKVISAALAGTLAVSLLSACGASNEAQNISDVSSAASSEATSEMFWGSLEAPQALSKETASVPARAALMTFFFMCIPLEKKIMYV